MVVYAGEEAVAESPASLASSPRSSTHASKMMLYSSVSIFKRSVSAVEFSIVHPDVVLWGHAVDAWLMWAAAILTVWSGIDYVGRYAGAFSRVRGR